MVRKQPEVSDLYAGDAMGPMARLAWRNRAWLGPAGAAAFSGSWMNSGAYLLAACSWVSRC
jgi:hypothetical protein